MTDEHVMNMPIKRFWLMSDSIDRIQAERDLRHISVITSANSADSIKEKINSLKSRIGKVVISDFGRDERGMQDLKRRLMLKK